MSFISIFYVVKDIRIWRDICYSSNVFHNWMFRFLILFLQRTSSSVIDSLHSIYFETVLVFTKHIHMFRTTSSLILNLRFIRLKNTKWIGVIDNQPIYHWYVPYVNIYRDKSMYVCTCTLYFVLYCILYNNILVMHTHVVLLLILSDIKTFKHCYKLIVTLNFCFKSDI